MSGASQASHATVAGVCVAATMLIFALTIRYTAHSDNENPVAAWGAEARDNHPRNNHRHNDAAPSKTNITGGAVQVLVEHNPPSVQLQTEPTQAPSYRFKIIAFSDVKYAPLAEVLWAWWWCYCRWLRAVSAYTVYVQAVERSPPPSTGGIVRAHPLEHIH